ncbi:diacylglycerol kinase family protein [Paenibacillus sp. FA6]|uniref:diacylglycerol kinase family protein n=1 Tax=Paenibacillus sp. FA6 TaxID=3413029 RepID=UPI003F65974C
MARKTFLSSFGFAVEGIRHAMTTQRNMKVHGVTALLVILAAAVLGVGPMQWLFLLLAITLVLTAELFNTALEAVVDLVSLDIHPLAKAAKDTAAGAVFITAAFAVIVGVVIFYKPIVELFGG